MFLSLFMLTYSIMRFLSLFTAGSVGLCGVCSPVVVPWSVCEVVVEPLCCVCGCCVDCDACTVVCVACVYAAIMLGCEGDGNAGVGSGGDVVTVSAYMGVTPGSGVFVGVQVMC